MPIPLLDLVLAFVVIAASAAMQGVIGMGFNVVSVPLLLLIHPLLAPVPNLLISLPLSVASAVREYDHIDFAGVGWVIGGRVPGTFAGLALLIVASERVLDVSIALIVLAMVAILAGGFTVRRTRTTQVGAGVMSGVASIVASMGGPPIALLYKNERGPTIRSTLAVMFSAGIAFSILLRALGGRITSVDVRVAAVLLPAVAIGFLVSSRIKGRVADVSIRRAILVVSATAAVLVLGRAVTG